MAEKRLDSSTDLCGKACDHGSPCLLYADHQPPDRHETQHGCIFYDLLPPTRVGGEVRGMRVEFHPPVTITDTGTGSAVTVERGTSICTCVRGPSSVVPSPSCPQHGYTPDPRKRG